MYHLSSSPAPTSTADYMYYHRTIQRLFPVDLTLLFCLVLFIIFCFGYMYYKYKKSIAMRTSLMLEISDGDCSYNYIQGDQRELPASFYRFTVSQQLLHITIKEFFFGIRLHWGPGLHGQNIPLDMQMDNNLFNTTLADQPYVQNVAGNVLRTRSRVHILNVNNDLQDLIVLYPRGGEVKTIVVTTGFTN